MGARGSGAGGRGSSGSAEELQATRHQPQATSLVTRRILTFWVVLFAFVGSQLGWTLRPFFGSPGMKFEVVREVGGNFYADVAKSAKEVFTVEENTVAANGAKPME